MPSPLAGQAAIVTGAATGIGAAIALELGARGVMVVIDHYHQKEEAKELATRIRQAGGQAAAIDADVSNPDDVNHLIEETLKAFGRLDIMVANAGVQDDAPSTEMTLKQWERVIHIDLRGQFLCAQGAIRQFRKQGVNPAISRAAGKIVCMLSVHDRIPWAGHVNYASAKAGARMLMESLAQECAAERIRIMGVSPGAIKTAINESVWSDPAKERELLKLIPYRRMGEPQDVAKAVAWLVSDEADYITGSTLYVDGGMMLYPGFVSNG